MAASPRELSFSYAGLSVGGASTTHQLWGGPYQFDVTYESIEFAAQVMCLGTDDASFALACSQLETAFHTPNGTLVVSINSQVIEQFGHSANTGFLARPICRKVGGPEDSARSRLYNVRVTAKRPADLSGKAGLQVASLTLRREVWGGLTYRVSGTYTAIGGSNAYDKYVSAIDGLLDSYETQLGGTWLRAEEDASQDDENKIVNFTRTGIQNGLRNGTLELTVNTNGLRSYSFTGMYTSETATDARAVYERDSGALFTSIETGLGGVWLRTNATSTDDQVSNTITFSQQAIQVGLRDATLTVTTDTNGLRSYTLEGQYEAETALNSNGVYLRDFPGLKASVETALGGTWLTTGGVVQDDQTKKITTFTSAAISTGLRQSTLDVFTTTNGLRSYRLSGQYEADGASDSGVVYAASIGALLTAVEASLGGTWLRTAKQYRDDQTRKITTFTHEGIETGLRDAVYAATKQATGRREYIVRGAFEATAANTALVEYQNSIDAVLTAYENDLGGSWDRTTENVRDDQTSRIVTFECSGLETVFPESSGNLNLPYLKNVLVSISSNQQAPGDSGSDTVRPVNIEATFQADVDITVPGVPPLKDVWTNTARPYLVSLARESASASAIAVTSETSQYMESSRKVSGSLTLSAYGGGTFIQRKITIQDDATTGVILIPVWNNDPDAKVRYQGPREIMRVVKDDAVEFAGAIGGTVNTGVGIGGSSSAASGISAPQAVAVPNDFELMRESNAVSKFFVGLGADKVELQARLTTRTYQFRKLVPRGT